MKNSNADWDNEESPKVRRAEEKRYPKQCDTCGRIEYAKAKGKRNCSNFNRCPGTLKKYVPTDEPKAEKGK